MLKGRARFDNDSKAHALPVPIHAKNRSQQTIKIVMDTEREVHRMGPAGADTFHLSIGDNPTYAVYEVVNGQRGRKPWSTSFNTVWVGDGLMPLPRVVGDLKWTEGRLRGLGASSEMV